MSLAPQPSLFPFKALIAMALILTFGLGMTVEAARTYLRQEIKRQQPKTLNPKVTQPRFLCSELPEMREACKQRAQLGKVGGIGI